MLNEEGLRAELKNAMQAKDRTRVRVLRAILAAAKNAAIEKKTRAHEEPDVLAVVKREMKQRLESLEYARQAGRAETVAELQGELVVLEEHLPKQLDETELRDAIGTIVADGGANTIGAIMKELALRYPGRYEGKLASRIAQEVLK